MTDRQIEVLEKAHSLILSIEQVIPGPSMCVFLYELEIIIKEQKELNLSSLKSQRAESVNNKP